MASEAGTRALDALDRVLAKQPHADKAILSEATKSLSTFRNELAAGPDRVALGRANAVMSMVLAAHFPLGDVPWDGVAQARGWLAELVG